MKLDHGIVGHSNTSGCQQSTERGACGGVPISLWNEELLAKNRVSFKSSLSSRRTIEAAPVLRVFNTGPEQGGRGHGGCDNNRGDHCSDGLHEVCIKVLKAAAGGVWQLLSWVEVDMASLNVARVLSAAATGPGVGRDSSGDCILKTLLNNK